MTTSIALFDCPHCIDEFAFDYQKNKRWGKSVLCPSLLLQDNCFGSPKIERGKVVSDRVCQFLQDAKQILKALRSLAEEAVITFAGIYGVYTVCRILIG